MDKPYISVVIPAFNSGLKIKGTIQSLKECNYFDQIIVVNDGSKDNTEELAKKENIEVISLKENRGKGFALSEGIKKVKGDIILLLDADLGNTAKEGKKLADELINNPDIDIVCGSFSVPGGFGFLLKFTKFVLKKLTNEDFTAPLSGQKAIKKSVLPLLLPLQTGYGVEVGMLLSAKKKGLKIKEMPVNMDHQRTGKDIKGIIHRAKQFKDIIKVFLKYT